MELEFSCILCHFRKKLHKIGDQMSIHVCIHVNTRPYTQLLRTEPVEEGEGAL